MRRRKLYSERRNTGVRTFCSLAFVGAVLLCGGAAYAGANSITTPKSTHEPSSDLNLTMRVVNESYCYHDAEMYSVVLALHLRYANQSAESVVLGKRVDAKAEVLVSTDITNQQRGIFEYRGMPPLPASARNKPGYGNVPDERFVILPPGGIYETDDSVEIPVTRAGLQPVADGVRPGEHVLTIKYFTWLEGQSLADQLRARWSHQGRLFSGVIESEPASFKVAANLETETCAKSR